MSNNKIFFQSIFLTTFPRTSALPFISVAGRKDKAD